MRKIVVGIVLAVFLLSTGSWAKPGKFTLGGLYSSKSTGVGGLSASSVGFQMKFGLPGNFELEGRFQTGDVNSTSPRVTLSCLTGLLVYNFPALSERFVPYIGAGVSQWTIFQSSGWTVTTDSANSCFTVLGGMNLYLTDQIALYADLGRESISATTITGVSLGANYTF